MSRAQKYQNMIVPALSSIGDFSMISVNSGTDGNSAGTYMQTIDAGYASIVDISSTCFTSTYIDQVQNLSSVLVSASTMCTDTLSSASHVTSTNVTCTSMNTHNIKCKYYIPTVCINRSTFIKHCTKHDNNVSVM